MAQSLFSSSWHRIALLKIRIREEVLVKRQLWRDELWYLLHDEVSGEMHRINMHAYQFIGRCDGNLTVQQVWDALLLEKEDQAPTQDEVIELISRLNQLSLLHTEQKANVSNLFERRKVKRDQQIRSYLNPFAIRIPLGDPSKWLNKLDHVAEFIFTPAMLSIWFLLIAITGLVAISEWNTISSHAKMHMLTPRYITLSLICFPLIKALHELGHGLAVRRWKGDVHEFGISLLVFVPAPYVDASTANAFTQKSQRMAVSAAGIIVEMFLAALSFIIWLNIQPGLIQDLAFVTMVIGTVSTLAFNGNPLLRFDGYYVLSDYLDMPNLATRSQQYWHHLLKNAMTFQAKPFDVAIGERKWLIGYTPLSYIYKCIVSVVIVLWLGSKWLLFGCIAAIYMAITLLMKPVYHWIKQTLAQTAPGQDLSRLKRNLTLLGLGISFGFFVIPLPFSTIAPAVIWLPEQTQIRTEENGFIKTLPIKNGELVKAGDIVAIIENTTLSKKREKLIGALDALKADRFQLLITNPSQAENLTQKVLNTEKQLEHINQQIKQLNITAKVDGKLIMPKQQDKLGSYIDRGDQIGYVLHKSQIRLRAAVPEQDAYLIRNKTKDIAVWLTDHQQLKGKVSMVMDTPAATRILPSAALGDHAGGTYTTDPSDKEGRQLLDPVFLFDLLVEDSAIQYIGSTAYVKFKHDATPLMTQLFYQANQLFLKGFKPSV